MYGPDIILQQIFYGVVLGSNYVLIAIGFSLIWGVVGVLNLAHGELFMLGAFAAYFTATYLGAGLLGVTFVAMLVVFAVGVALEKLAIEPLRRREKVEYEMSTLIMTIGISMCLQNLALIVFGAKYKGIPGYFDGLVRVGGLIVTYDRLATFVFAAGIVGALLLVFRYTRLGLAMRAVSENPDAAALVGIPRQRVLAWSFGVSGALAAAAGALLIPLYNAYPTVGTNIMLLAFSIVIFGGLGRAVNAH